MAIPLPPEFIPHVEATKRPIVRHAHLQIGEVGIVHEKRERVNATKAVWDLKFVALPFCKGNKLADLLEAARGIEPILWQPPDEDAPIAFTVESIDRTYTRSHHSTIAVTLEQTF